MPTPQIDWSNPAYKTTPQTPTPTGSPKATIDWSNPDYLTRPGNKGTAPSSSPVAPKMTLMQKLGGGVKKAADFESKVATEASKSVVRDVLGAGQAGLGVENALNSATGGRITGKAGVGGIFNTQTQQGAAAVQKTQANGGASGLVGTGVAQAAEVLAGGPEDVIQGGVDLAKGATKQGGKLVAKLALGKEGVDTLEKLSDTEAQKFIKGKTFSETAKNVQAGLTDFENKSRSALQAVKQQIPKVEVGGGKIAQKLNEGILSAVRSNAAYKGVEGEVEQAFKNPKDLINSGLLNDDEAKKVQGIVNVVKNWKDTSARGVLNLKEQLDPFYTDGLKNSNKILRSVQSGLKDLVGEAHPAIKSALKEASDNIEKANDFKRQLGKDAVATETKLGTIARGLKNPAANASKISLLKQVESATGKSLLPEIHGYSKYLDLIKNGADQIPTKTGTILKQVGTRTGIAGGLLAGGAELKKLLGL